MSVLFYDTTIPYNETINWTNEFQCAETFGSYHYQTYIDGHTTRFRSINGISVKGLLFINPIPIFVNNLKHQSFSTRKYKFFVSKCCAMTSKKLGNSSFWHFSYLGLTLGYIRLRHLNMRRENWFHLDWLHLFALMFRFLFVL